jgi:hypothetical protein
MTSVALTTAVTTSPFFRDISSALRRVITDSITFSPTHSHTYGDVCEHVAQLNLVDRPLEVISGAQSHWVSYFGPVHGFENLASFKSSVSVKVFRNATRSLFCSPVSANPRTIGFLFGLSCPTP